MFKYTDFLEGKNTSLKKNDYNEVREESLMTGLYWPERNYFTKFGWL